LCPEQVACDHDGPAEVGLVDCWGRINPIGSPTQIGREQDGLSILEPSVSRRHAVIEETDEGSWQVRDTGSSNGTTVNGRRIAGREILSSGDILFFGDVGFMFVSSVPSTVALPAIHATLTPGGPDEEDEENEATFSGLRDAPIRLNEHSGGAGGVLDIAGTSVQLTLVQYELFRVLHDRMKVDQGRDERVRGFVRSSELLVSLPWDTARADENHLKQLIRRVRRILARAAVPDIIEARHGFGYRLRIRTAEN
jgi:hypothetical protein